MTVYWDSTPDRGITVNAIQVSNAQQLFTVSVARLPGGKAVDYVEHFVSTVNCLAQTYSAYCGDEELLVRQSICEKMLSCLTDRAKTNTAVTRLLNAHLGIDMIALHCNVHPLDGFASHGRQALQELDEGGMSAVKFMHDLSKLRCV